MLSLTALVLLSVAAAGTAAGGPSAKPRFTATPLTAAETFQGVKSRTARLAETDPSLLGRTDATIVPVVVKFDYDSTATYEGGITGLAATSPKVTGKKLKANRGAVQAYEQHIAKVERQIVQGIEAKVDAVVGQSFRTVYGGVAMRVSANQIGDLLAVEGVVAVQKDSLEQPLTDSSPDFVGATSAWGGLGGSTKAGEGVIVGVLDSGIWPEHDSFNDNGIDHPGGTYACEFGSGLDPLLGAPYSCDDKLVGAYAVTDTYMAVIGAAPGEYCNNVTDECSARDSDGHGTHTASTAAGSAVEEAVLLGVDQGPISGIAPGASVIMYRVCLDQGCFGSDSVAAVEQAIVDGVDVINFSISGGASAYTDPVELSFLDAYAAGALVNASAGNSGPARATAAHAGPWVNTVGASTSDRHFFSTLKLTAANGAVFEQQGVTVTAGVTGKDVVLATAVGSTKLCDTPANPALSSGKVVVCERGGNARVDKGYRMFQAGAAGMILYNPNIGGLNSDSHWLPAIHLEGPASGTHPLVTYLAANSGVKATWVSGTPTPVLGDTMAAFSSRGPVGDFIKPDVTSVGVQVLAGNTPTPISTDAGPPGQLYQAIAGTSMSSPHAAGVSALVKAAHPDWTPGQLKSALMTSSVQSVVKEDGITPADPFDRGAGSIRANRAVAPTVTFDVTAAEYVASAADALSRIHLNLPSINANPMSGVVTTERTMKNVSGTQQVLRASSTAPSGASIDVSPKTVVVGPGEEATITITINATDLADGQYFGQVTLAPNRGGFNDVVLPVAFVKGQGTTSLVHTCDPTTFRRGTSADCVVQAQNLASVPAEASLTVQGPNNGQLQIQNVSAPGVVSGNGFTWSGTLSPALAPPVESITAGGPPYGYLPLSGFGVAPTAMGDETIVNFNVPAFQFGGETYTRVGAVSNGYAVIGGGTSADVEFEPQTFPNAAPPNNVVAPYWTDLNMSVAGSAFRAEILGDGTTEWLILDWANAAVYSNNAQKQSFQIWIELGGTEDITWVYGPVTSTSADPRNIGAENRDGSSGVNVAANPVAGAGYTVNMATPIPGGAVTITYDAFGRNAGTFDVLASLTSSVVQGTTTEKVTLEVTR